MPNRNQDIESHFLNLVRIGACPDTSYAADDEEECPTELNTFNSSGGFMVVANDKLSVQYTSVNLHGHDVGVVQANCPAPVKRIVYYFEMTVKNAGVKGQVAIGFTTDSFKKKRQPGWEANSFGYHGDDGVLYRGHGRGDPFGPTYTTGDTVGCGINYASQEIFFTKNGTEVGKTSKNIKDPLYPTIAVHSQNEEVSVNFGKEPFIFDLKRFETLERMKQQAMIEEVSLPENISYSIVRSYLVHYGYEDTLKAYDSATNISETHANASSENGIAKHDDMYQLSQRRIIREIIRSGNIDAAFEKLETWYPKITEDTCTIGYFLLHCQKFIELTKAGKLEDAVRYAQLKLVKYFGLPGYEDVVKDCVTLLAYVKPDNTPVGYLLKDSQRDIVADTVNAHILSLNPSLTDSQSCLYSNLERLIRQLTACCLERRHSNGDQGEAFCLPRLLNTSK
ncbi:unnamed protein product [Rhodiola kirilowii]